MTNELARPEKRPGLVPKVVNFVVFQATYAACVLGAASGHPWLGASLGAAVLPLNLAFVPARRRKSDTMLWLAICAVGTSLDSALYAAGVIGFPQVALAPTLWPEFLVPPWIAVLWLGVGSMLRSSLAWLGAHKILATTLGAIGGPLSFWSGAQLGATELPMNAASLAALAIEYAIILPLLLLLAGRSISTP